MSDQNFILPDQAPASVAPPPIQKQPAFFPVRFIFSCLYKPIDWFGRILQRLLDSYIFLTLTLACGLLFFVQVNWPDTHAIAAVIAFVIQHYLAIGLSVFVGVACLASYFSRKRGVSIFSEQHPLISRIFMGHVRLQVFLYGCTIIATCGLAVWAMIHFWNPVGAYCDNIDMRWFDGVRKYPEFSLLAHFFMILFGLRSAVGIWQGWGCIDLAFLGPPRKAKSGNSDAARASLAEAASDGFIRRDKI